MFWRLISQIARHYRLGVWKEPVVLQGDSLSSYGHRQLVDKGDICEVFFTGIDPVYCGTYLIELSPNAPVGNAIALEI